MLFGEQSIRMNSILIGSFIIVLMGIVDDINITPIKKKVKNGDIIVTISDGVIDVDKGNIGDYSWIVDYLEGEKNNPELISRDILELANKKCNGRVLDDMTIVVSKLYSC